MTTAYTCHSCGESHDDLPRTFAAPAPDLYYQVPEAEREERAPLNTDLCVIDETYFFVRANLDVPILGEEGEGGDGAVFSWGIWVSLSDTSFDRMCEIWEKLGRESEPHCFGWLSTSLPGYPETNPLKTHVHYRPLGERPSLQLEPTDHPLAVEQRTGITPERAREIAERLLHDLSD